MLKTLNEHLNPDTSNGPKRILALDGGGIRGALTLGFLKKMEELLRTQEGDPDLLLCDYFDLIGGTSTGSIIAAGLAIGMSVDEITEKYMVLGGKIFGKKHNWMNPLKTWKYLKAKFDHQSLEDSLKDVFQDITLGSDKIRTGLCIVAKRADTNSTWPLHNHPNGMFYNNVIEFDGKDQVVKNKDIPLWQVVRASSAAPTYFAPLMIEVGEGETGAFIDGGVSMANNPALTLLMVATLKGFRFNWEFGEDKLELISVGTGYSIFKKHIGEIKKAHMLSWASSLPDMLMQDASWQNQIILQWLSNSETSIEIDMETGDMKDDVIGNQAMINYLRYNFAMTVEELNKLDLNRDFLEEEIDEIVEMSNSENRYLLYKIGNQAAKNAMKAEHFIGK